MTETEPPGIGPHGDRSLLWQQRLGVLHLPRRADARTQTLDSQIGVHRRDEPFKTLDHAGPKLTFAAKQSPRQRANACQRLDGTHPDST